MVMSFPSLSICKEQSKQQEHERPQSQLCSERKKEKGAKFSFGIQPTNYGITKQSWNCQYYALVWKEKKMENHGYEHGFTLAWPIGRVKLGSSTSGDTGNDSPYL
jgi:hypothetical protein